MSETQYSLKIRCEYHRCPHTVLTKRSDLRDIAKIAREHLKARPRHPDTDFRVTAYEDGSEAFSDIYSIEELEGMADDLEGF